MLQERVDVCLEMFHCIGVKVIFFLKSSTILSIYCVGHSPLKSRKNDDLTKSSYI